LTYLKLSGIRLGLLLNFGVPIMKSAFTFAETAFILYRKNVKESCPMFARRLSSEGQVTVPREIRQELDLEPGDYVAYEVRDGVVVLRKVQPFDAAFHKTLAATLDEWSTPEDEEAFRDL
jgi:antitoxin PrlF